MNLPQNITENGFSDQQIIEIPRGKLPKDPKLLKEILEAWSEDFEIFFKGNRIFIEVN